MSVITAIVLAAVGCTEPPAPPAALHLAELAPPDVRLCVQLRAAADWRSAVASRPMARCLETLLTRGQLAAAWGRLADAADLEPAALFDATLGRDVAIFVRGEGDATEWVAVAEADPGGVDLLVQRLAARMLAPVSQVAMLELPDHDLLVARRGARLVVGPAPGSSLFFEVVPRLGGAVEPPPATLAGVEALAAAAALGGGSAGVYLRHDAPIGGWSVAVADLQDNRLTIRHAARFELSPFDGPPAEAAWDVAPIQAIEGASILAFIEPSGGGGGPLDAFLQAGLGRSAFVPELRANLGARRITAISDLDGRLAEPPFDLLLPTFARADEVKDAEAAWPLLDRSMLGLLRRLDEIRGGEQPLALPDPGQLPAQAPRQVEIGPLVVHFLGKFPGAERTTLNWMVQAGPQANWSIVATGREHMLTLAAALAAAPGPEAPGIGRWESCGTFDGPRLAEHLRSWRAAASLLAGPADQPAVSEGLLLFSQLADGIERGRWRLSRPSPHDALTEIELLLSPPESSEAAPGR